MANTASAKKAIRVIEARTAVNKARRSRMRGFIRKVEEAIASGDKQAAQDALKAAQPEIMRAAQKGVIHKNVASRKVSRFACRLKAARRAHANIEIGIPVRRIAACETSSRRPFCVIKPCARCHTVCYCVSVVLKAPNWSRFRKCLCPSGLSLRDVFVFPRNHCMLVSRSRRGTRKFFDESDSLACL